MHMFILLSSIALLNLSLQVSIPLMDIALQCLMTSSGSHLQHYVLVPAEPVKAR